MRVHTNVPSVATLGVALLLASGAIAADPPKEGTFSDTAYGFGTYKGTAIGKTRYLSTFEENGQIVGTGLTDHMTAHCFGVNDRKDDTREGWSWCVYTDVDGDQIVTDATTGKYPRDAKSNEGTATLTSGTGKYAGISGVITYVCGGASGFKAPTEGTFFISCDRKGTYRIP